MLSRRAFALAAASWAGGPWAAMAQQRPDLGMKISDSHIADAIALLRRYPSVDVHSHPGRFFMRGPGAPPPFAATAGEPFPEQAISHMREGRVSGVQFAAVADLKLLGAGPLGIAAVRDYAAGEAYADYQRQLALLQALVAEGDLMPGLSAAAVRLAHARGRTACIFSIEGGDFIEDRLERVKASHDDGVRSVTIIHYKVNQIGDTQTSPAVHGGLSAFGRQVVRALNEAGILIDLSHASMDATRHAAQVSAQPMIISHSNLRMPGLDHPRLISVEHARLVTESGGVVGALPAGAGQVSFAAYIDTIMRAIDALGINHVAVGTDMDFTFAAVLSDYSDWSLIPAGLLARGMHPPEIGKIVGGNFLRLMSSVQRK